MRSIRACGLLVLVLIVGLVTSLTAKGVTVKLTITGGHLSRPVDVTNPTALVDVWSGARPARSWWDFPTPFIGKTVATEPAAALPRYDVSFYVKTLPEQRVQMLYAVTYVPDPETGSGYIFIPKHDSAVIARPGDGKWSRASAEWSSAINAALAAAQ
jgi:hypothetical protein